MIRTTHTYADLVIPQYAYDAIVAALIEASSPGMDYVEHYTYKDSPLDYGLTLSDIRLVPQKPPEQKQTTDAPLERPVTPIEPILPPRVKGLMSLITYAHRKMLEHDRRAPKDTRIFTSDTAAAREYRHSVQRFTEELAQFGYDVKFRDGKMELVKS